MLVILKVGLIFGWGLILGSFVNVLIERTQKNESLWGRSKCDKCGYQLSWFDNIPLLSFLMLKGKCRKCKQKIKNQYPLMELFFGILFLTVAWKSHLIGGILWDEQEILAVSFLLLITFLLGVIFIWDLKYTIIPDGLIAGGLIISVIYYGYLYWISSKTLLDISNPFMAGWLGALAVGGFFYALYSFSQGRWVGGGDVKLGFWLGFLVGWQWVYWLLLMTYVFGAIVASCLLISKRKKLRSRIPFGPFLVFSAWVLLLWRDDWQMLLKWVF